jgi:carboxyl-terminal processing protease
VMVISFRERPNTRSFGIPTKGLSTGNSNFDLGENTILVLCSSTMADRTKKTYGKRVDPDVIETNADSVVAKAIRWLLE